MISKTASSFFDTLAEFESKNHLVTPLFGAQSVHTEKVIREGKALSVARDVYNALKRIGNVTYRAAMKAHKGLTGTAKVLYGGPKRRFITVPATVLAATKGESIFDKPTQYVNPENNTYTLEPGIFLNSYKRM